MTDFEATEGITIELWWSFSKTFMIVDVDFASGIFLWKCGLGCLSLRAVIDLISLGLSVVELNNNSNKIII